jgi:putative addiction module CopG family antidote
MEVRLTPEQETLIRQGIESGEYKTVEDAVHEALARWEEEKRARAELLALIDEGEADLAAGRYTDYTNETLPELIEQIKREGRALRDSRLR